MVINKEINISGCSTGVDLIEIDRIRSCVATWGDKFLSRIYTSVEIQAFYDRKRSYQYLAGRFAAKEAVKKAFGVFGQHIPFNQINIMTGPFGAPTITEVPGINMPHEVQVSISHTREYAVATCIINASGGNKV